MDPPKTIHIRFGLHPNLQQLTEEIILPRDKIIRQGMLQKKSSKLPIWTDRFGVLVLRKDPIIYELILYTFYSEDFREGASRKYSLR